MFCNQICCKIILEVLTNNFRAVRWNSNVKMTKQLVKMMNRGPKKKTWYAQPVPVSSDVVSQSSRKGPTDGQRRRAVQVGKILYEYIAQIVNSGELCPQLAEMAVAIEKVKIVADFSAVNVHWLATGTQEDDRIEILLKENAGKLRYLLTSYHLLGHIPVINFVKDVQEANIMKVQNLLKIADYGPDFQPSEFTTQMRTNKTGKKRVNIVREFTKLSLEQTDSRAYPNIMTVTETGAVVEENPGQVNKYETTSPTPEPDADLKQIFDVSDRDDIGLKQNFSLDMESKVYHEHNLQNILDKNSKNDDPYNLSDIKIRSDLYDLPHDNLMKKLLMKKQKAKHRTGSDTFMSDGFKDPEISAQAVKPDYGAFLRKRKTLKRVKGKIPYTVRDYLRNEGIDYWNPPREATDSTGYNEVDNSDDDE